MTTGHSLPSLSSSSLRKQLFGYFFLNSEQRLHLREIARQINADPANLSRELERLVKEGVFCSEKKTHQRDYYLNKNYPLFSELKSIVNKTMGIKAALQNFLQGIPGVKKAFIYGSFARGEERSGSDIDVCLIVEKKSFSEQPLLQGIEQVEKQLGRDISYVYFNEQEWEKKQRKNDSFVKGLLKSKRIEI